MCFTEVYVTNKYSTDMRDNVMCDIVCINCLNDINVTVQRELAIL